MPEESEEAGSEDPSLPKISPIIAGNKRPELPASVSKSFSPRCPVCTSRYFDLIHQYIASGTKSMEISRALAKMGEIVSPNAINRHKKNHMANLSAVQTFYKTGEMLSAEQELCAQIALCKLELSESVDLEYRKFLMRRIDKLLIELGKYQLGAAKLNSPSKIDARHITINTQAPSAPIITDLPLEALEAQLKALSEAMSAGKLETIDAADAVDAELVGAEEQPRHAKPADILAPNPLDASDL